MSFKRTKALSIVRSKRVGQRLLAGLLGCAMIIGSVVGIGAAAHAANQVSIDSVDFVTKDGDPVHEFDDKTLQWLEVHMSITGTAVTPVAGTFMLPDGLVGQNGSIVLTAPDGEPNGRCTITATQVDCYLDDDYVLANPEDMEGWFRFQVRVDVDNDEDLITRFPIVDNQTNEVTIHPYVPGEWCTVDCELKPELGSKIGWYDTTNETIGWEIRVPTPGSDGMPVGQRVTVIDDLDLDLYELRAGSPYVEYYDAVELSDTGREQFYERKSLPADKFTVSDNGTRVDFVTEPGRKGDPTLPQDVRGLEGRVYWVTWSVNVRDGGAAGTYRNSATVIINDGEAEYDLEGETTRESGEGGAVGHNQGRLAFEKFVEGSASHDPNLPTAYRVEYTACDTGAADYDHGTHTGSGCADGSLELRPGQTVWSKSFPAGTRVVGTEVYPTEPANVSWDGQFQLVDAAGNPIPGESENSVFDVTFSSGNGNLGRLTYYRVTNDASYRDAAFTARKVIDNPSGLDTSGIADFTLNYSYPADPNGAFPAGNGRLLLAADGSVSTSGPLPIGAQLTFTEGDRPVIPGGVWHAPSIVPATLTITEDMPGNGDALVVVTNPLRPEPVPGFELSKSAAPVSGSNVHPGDVITYTVTGENTGETVLDPVVITDDLDGIWEFATYNGDAFATIDGTTAAGSLRLYPGDPSWQWTGALNAGEKVTITYSATVNANASGQVLDNKVSGSATPPGKPPITPPDETTQHPVPKPGFLVQKSADPPTDSDVFPGDTITYTVTGKNTGETVLDPVVITDELANIWDYVTYNDDEFATVNGTDPSGVLALDSVNKQLTWTGVLQPGETVTITYSVTVEAQAVGQELQNRVSGSAKPPGLPPITPPPTDTEHRVPTPGFDIDKTSEPASGTEVHPGQRITYTVTGENTGATRLDPVVITDDLSGVLDFATFESGSETAEIAGAAAGSLVLNEALKRLTWTGALEPGEIVVISYSIIVNDDASGQLLENRVTGSAEPPGLPPIEPPPVDTEHPVPTPGFEIVKRSAPLSGATVMPGDRVSYTVRGENTGETVLDPVVLIDDMSGALEHASYNGDASVTINGQPAAAPVFDEAAGTLTWSGVLRPGEQAILSYSVTVNDDAAGVLLENRLSGSATPPGLPPITPPDEGTEHPVGGFEIAKESDPVSGAEVHPGDTITYTVSGQNTGATELEAVTLSDDLSGLSRYTTFNDDAVVMINGVPASDPLYNASAQTLTWTGDLQAGETVTMTYTVTVNDDASGQLLKNVLSGSAIPPDHPPVTPPDEETEHPVPTPGFELGKSSNPASGTEVHPGDTITYAVTGVNTGETVLDPVTVTDDLSGLLEYAEFNDDAVAQINGVDAVDPVFDPGSSTLAWSGALRVGETVTVTYSVTVGQDAGGQLLENVVSGSGTPPGLPPITPPDEETEHPVPTPGFELGKSSNPASGASVIGGDRVTYSLVGENTGGTILDPVVLTDDLSGVLGAADLDPESVNARIDGVDSGIIELDLDAAQLSWSGALRPGERVVVSYAVVVHEDAQGQLLENRLSGEAKPPGVPPITPPDESTTHPVAGFELAKGSDPESGAAVRPGQTITYVVTGRNTGATVLDPVAITDDLSGVLEHASYNNDAAATIAGEPVADPVFDAATSTLSWNGVLQQGEVVRITYSVTVSEDAHGQLLENRVNGSATPPERPPFSPPEITTQHPVPPLPSSPIRPTQPSQPSQPSGKLQATGAEGLGLGGVGLMLLLAGGVTLGVLRLRRRNERRSSETV